MTTPDAEFDLELSRRKLLAAAGIGGAAAVVASLVGTGAAEAAPDASRLPDPVATPPVAGLHLQFGADASSEMVVSWHTLQPVQNPRVLLGRLDGKLEQKAAAKTISYTDAKSGKVVYAHHAKIASDCKPTSPAYLYVGAPRGRRAGVRHLPHLPARPRAGHVHQRLRSGHAHPRQEVCATRGGGDDIETTPSRPARCA